MKTQALIALLAFSGNAIYSMDHALFGILYNPTAHDNNDQNDHPLFALSNNTVDNDRTEIVVYQQIPTEAQTVVNNFMYATTPFVPRRALNEINRAIHRDPKEAIFTPEQQSFIHMLQLLSSLQVNN